MTIGILLTIWDVNLQVAGFLRSAHNLDKFITNLQTLLWAAVGYRCPAWRWTAESLWMRGLASPDVRPCTVSSKAIAL